MDNEIRKFKKRHVRSLKCENQYFSVLGFSDRILCWLSKNLYTPQPPGPSTLLMYSDVIYPEDRGSMNL